jgi:hypothetical protein
MDELTRYDFSIVKCPSLGKEEYTFAEGFSKIA